MSTQGSASEVRVDTGALRKVPEFPHRRVLVADDDQEVCLLVERIVGARLKAQVSLALDGDEALVKLQQGGFDCLITDMNMPGRHGLDLIRAAKAVVPPVQILVMTGYPSEFPFLAVIESGADDFINKPFGAGELEAKLVRLFRELESDTQRRLFESRYRSLFEFSADGMVLLDTQDYRIEDGNQAFCRLCGVEGSEARGRRILEFFEERDRVRLEHWLSICARSGKGTMADLVLTGDPATPVHVDVSVSFIKNDGAPFVYMAFKDVTEKREVANRLAEAAQRDELTGLLNKRSFQNHIEGGVARVKSAGMPMCLLLIDLDNFKQCNDTHGHQIGDRLLMSVGDAIHKSIRAATSDAGFRCGGDEFAVLVFGTSKDGAANVAERIQAEFAKQESYGTTMSIGVAEYADGMATETFIRMADEALYRAKGSGKNTVNVA